RILILVFNKARRRVRLIVSKDEDNLKDPSKQERKIAQIDEDEGITLVQIDAQTQGRNEHEVESDFDFTTAKDISTVNVPVTTAGAGISTACPEDKIVETFDDSDDITLAKTLIEIRRSATKPQKLKGVAFRDVEETPRLVRSTTRLQPLPFIDPKDMEVDRAQKERQKLEEATIALLTEEFNEIQARMDDDHELATRMTYEE
nr:hypothetical protein [Tanacetum cinerariifolium]